MAAAFLRLQVALGVTDVVRSAAFYAGNLGFALKAQMGATGAAGEPPTFALLARDTVTLSLVATEIPAVADFACCYIYVDDVDAVHDACVQSRTPIVNPLTRHPWGNRDFVIRDPDGHRLAIGQTAVGTAAATAAES
jgi:catechol 2,3-dioxygenase-like lactoylglutathione lyase family enzyme